MQNIDKLACVAKVLFEERVLGQRKEIEQLKKKSLDNHYLVVFAESGYRTCEMNLIQAASEEEAINKLTEMKFLKDQLDDLNEGLKRNYGTPYPDTISWIKGLIKQNEIILVKLDQLISNVLYVDPKHQEIDLRKLSEM